MSKVGSLEIDIAANVARLQEDFAAAKKEVKNSTHGIAQSVKEMQEAIEESMAGVSKAMKALTEIGELAGLTEFGAKIAEMAGRSAEFAESIEMASQKTGVGAEELQGLKFAAQESGMAFDGLQTGLVKLSKSMIDAEQGNKKTAEAFQAVGISAKDLKNMSPDEVLMKVSQAFHDASDGADKTAIAIALFGKSGADMIPFLNKGSEAIDEMKGRAKELGVVMDASMIERGAEAKEKYGELGQQIQAVGLHLGDSLTPMMRQASMAISEGLEPGHALDGILQALNGTIRFVGGAVSVLVLTFQGLTQAARAVITYVGGGLVVALGAAWKALHLDFAGAAATFDSGMAIVHDSLADLSAEGQKDGQAFMEAITGVINKNKELDEAPKAHLHFGADLSQMASFMQMAKAQLQKLQEDENGYHEISKEQELAFWQSKLSLCAAGSKDYLAVRSEMFSLEKAMAKDRQAAAVAEARASIDADKMALAAKKEGYKQQQAMGEITYAQMIALDKKAEDASFEATRDALTKELSAYQSFTTEYKKIVDEQTKLAQAHANELAKLSGDEALHELKDRQSAAAENVRAVTESEKRILAAKEESYKQQLAAGQITYAQMIAMDKAAEQESYANVRNALAQELSLYKDFTKEYKKIKDDMTAVDLSYNQSIQKLTTQASEKVRQDWQQALQPIANSFTTTITQMITKGQTLRQSMQAIMRSMTQDFVKMCVDTLVKWAANQLAKTTLMQSAQAIQSKLFGSTEVTQAATAKAGAAATIPAEAAVAAGGAASAMAGIPYVGPAMAAAAYAETMAMVMGGMSMISAAGGNWQIPSDQMAMVHKNETILPANIATPMREAFTGGGMGGGAPTIHIHATDSQDVARLFKNNGSALTAAAKNAMRNFKK